MIEKEKKHNLMESRDKAQLLGGWLVEKQASEVIGLDVDGLCHITEALVIVSAKGVRHAQALADSLLDRSGQENIEYLGMEGYNAGGWILMDFNDVVVHIFQAEQRSLYNLEGLWAEADSVPMPGDGVDA
ncbi:MAG: ribosome silencing factor [Desulfovibrio sp.]|jgi:ribosome-associated protein|nr:ribosome silencing factor [Desulfovibrio sp.]